MESSTHSTDPTIEPIDWRDVNERAAEKNYADESKRIAHEYNEGLISEADAIRQMEDLSIANKQAHSSG